MTELERHDPDRWREAAVAPVQQPSIPDGVAAIQIWARTAQAASELVERLVDSPFVPDAFRPRIDPRATAEQRYEARQIAVATATAAVLYGGEIGLSPMQALSNVIVIKGKPSLYAETMVALVMAAGHEIWEEELTDSRAVVCGRRAGEAIVRRGEMTMERARKAGYVAQNKKYNDDPKSMLYARAASIACRKTAPEVLKGIPVAEELWDEDDGSPQPAVRTAQRAVKPRPAPVRAAAYGQAVAAPVEAAGPPPLPGEDGYDQPTEPTVPGITKAQQSRLHATFGDLNVSDRAAKLRIAVEIVGRPLSSSTELTKDEATGLIDTLSQMTPETVLALIEDDGPTDGDVAALNAEAAEQAAAREGE